MRFRSASLVCGLTALLLSPVPAAARRGQPGPAKPRFAGTGVVETNEGHATLRWSLPGTGGAEAEAPDLVYELERSRDPAFGNHRLLHRGPESAFFVSGLRDGRNYFRVRAAAAGSAVGPWSEVLVVDVDYPGRGQVVLLLGVGCLVFVGTGGAIVAGWLQTRRRRLAARRAGA